MSHPIAETDHPIQAVMAERWSPYAFDAKSVSNEDLRSLFEAARWAASSYNEQPWRYILARREEGEAFERLLSVLVEANQAWAKAAPVLALGVVKRNFERNGKLNKAAFHDLGQASAQLALEATARGLTVHQMIGIDPERAREIYAIPEDAEAFTAIAIGYAASPEHAPEPYGERDRSPRVRRPLSETVFGTRWGAAADLS